MKLIENSTITLYKIPFVDENLFDFHDNSLNSEEFSTNFHSALYTFATIANRLLFPLSDARSIKITDASLQIVLPIKKSRLEGFTLIECKTNELYPGFTTYVYFNIVSITSLNDNDKNPSCQLFCSINYYYSYLFDIQLSLPNTQVNFEMHHVKRYEKTTNVELPLSPILGVEGCAGVKFSQYNSFVDYPKQPNGQPGGNVLWLYITLDNNAQFEQAKNNEIIYGTVGAVEFGTVFGDRQRVIACPIGYYSDRGFEPFKYSRWVYSLNGEQRNEIHQQLFFGISDGNNVIDAYYSNQEPPFEYSLNYYSDGINDYLIPVISSIPLIPAQKINNNYVVTTYIPGGCCFAGTISFVDKDGVGLFAETIKDNYKGKRDRNYSFATERTSISKLQDFSTSVFDDPAFNLYPFTKLSTICGEYKYFPSKFREKFTITSYSYLRSINFICLSTVTDNNKIFYLNAFISPSSFARYSKDVMNTFYRNNSGQYRVKMTTERSKSVVQILTGVDTAKANMYARGRVGYDYFDTRGAQNTLVGGVSYGTQGMAMNATGAGYSAAVSQALGNVANGIIDLVSSHAMKDARDFDMANAQDDYVNTVSNQYGDCQILTPVLYTPNKDSEEFKQLAYQIYYFGYPREEIGMAGENNRIIYDYKKVSAIYSEITNNAAVSAYMKIILLNGATFWHLENLNSLTSDQKRQIITTANKYGIANYEPNLD